MPIFYSGEDYLALPREPQPWLIKHLLPVGGLVNLYGKPKTRKSWAALGMALAIANGEHDWNGLEVRKQGPVLYLQADTPREEWADRLARLKRFGYNISNLYVADMGTVPVYPFNVLDPETTKLIREAAGDIKPVLTIIDTLRESHAGDENDSSHMLRVIQSARAMLMPSALMFLSHQRKDSTMQKEQMQTDLMDDARGSSYISGRMDVIARLTDRSLTYKGRAVKQTMKMIEAAPDGDMEDPNTPPPMIVFEDTGMKELEDAVRLLLQSQPAISAKAAAEHLVATGATKLGAEHLRKRVLPGMFKRLGQQPTAELPLAA